jgi:hypothetical protein
LENKQVEIHLKDLENNLSCNGASGSILIPHEDFPWYEIGWSDERNYREVLCIESNRPHKKIMDWIGRIPGSKQI